MSNYDTNISHNRASNGGAIYGQDSSFEISRLTTLTDNIAEGNGGAFYLSSSKIRFLNRLSPLMVFEQNDGTKGGAIFVSDRNCDEVARDTDCFVTGTPTSNASILFCNNSAIQGSVLYGGLLDRCFQNHFKQISDYKPTPLAITSDPVRVCLCDNDLAPDCSTRALSLAGVKRGQTIDLIGTIVDQDQNQKVSFVKASYSSLSTQLDKGEEIIQTGSECRNLSYHIFSSSSSAVLTLQPDGYCEYSNFSSITVHITVAPCSKGFEKHDDRCICDNRLTKLFGDIVCDVNTDSMAIRERSNIWLRYDQEHLKVHGNCPLDYCQVSSHSINLEHPDEQCASNRTGIICGACRANYSTALGGSKCLQCTSRYSPVWLIPVLAAAGVALVALLLLCNMTISHGTLNGLIFYANVVSIARLSNLQNCSINPVLSVFIAWINLDFGVETCFYSGMDTYQKTWLQFTFPLYIWLLVGGIILVSHYSTTATRIFGRNSIAVLATLFLLSYTKILKTIFTALHSAQVLQGSANDTNDMLIPYRVWAFDGNIEYLKGKHVPLFAVALALLVLLFLPYTLLLMFGQCIRSLPTQRKCVVWFIHSTAFISIMDAYHAPYSKRHRYWTGLTLLIRCVLFFAFTSSYKDDEVLENMYITTIVLIAIFIFKSCTTKTYKYFYINLLENCFFLNLAVLSATLYYLRGESSDSDAKVCWCVTASLSVSLVLFGGILAYHAYLIFNKTRCVIFLKDAIHAKLMNREKNTTPLLNPVQKVPTTTTVILREELLESDHK